MVLPADHSCPHLHTPNANLVTWKHQVPAHFTNIWLLTWLHLLGMHKKRQEMNKKKGHCTYYCWIHPQEWQDGKINTCIFENGLLENGHQLWKLKLYYCNTILGGLDQRPAQAWGYCLICNTFLCLDSCFRHCFLWAKKLAASPA